jgi:hypothetical protein
MKAIAWLGIVISPFGLAAVETVTKEGAPLRDALVREAAQPSKPTWQPMLLYLAELHGRSVFPPLAHFKYPFESIGPGYQGGMVFGHIDLTHERLDTVRARPEHTRNQIRNELAGQQDDGLVPGIIIFNPDGKPWWKNFKGFPPIWVVSAEAYAEVTGDVPFLAECLDALRKQIRWFEGKRAGPGGGFTISTSRKTHGKAAWTKASVMTGDQRNRRRRSTRLPTCICFTITPRAGAKCWAVRPANGMRRRKG